jgi:hypothetical protein
LIGINVLADWKGIFNRQASSCSAYSQGGAEMSVLKALFSIYPQAPAQILSIAAQFVWRQRISGFSGITT